MRFLWFGVLIMNVQVSFLYVSIILFSLIAFLPGHSPKLQSIISKLSATQSDPPFLGAGFVHDLDLDCEPDPQVALQSVQSLQGVQPPFTGSPCSTLKKKLLFSSQYNVLRIHG